MDKNEDDNNDQVMATQLSPHLRESCSKGNVSWALSMVIHPGGVGGVLQQQPDYTPMSPCACPAQCTPPTAEV